MNLKFAYIIVFFLPFIVYLPTLSGTFYYDDNVIFFGHQVNVLADNPFSVFKGQMHYLPGAPRSIHVFFLLVLYKIFGPTPLPFHLFNLILHCIATLMFFVLLRRAMDSKYVSSEEGEGNALAASVFGALLFGLHPVHLENIVFVTLGGTDLFYTFWAFLSLVLYVKFRDSSSPSKYALFALSVAAYYPALISKESAVVFVLIYPLTELLIIKEGRGVFALRSLKGCLWVLPYAALLLITERAFIFGMTAMVVGKTTSGEGGAGAPEVLKSLGFFVKSLVFPYPHNSFVKELRGETLLYSLAALTGASLVASFIWRKRLLSFALLWFLITALPYLFVPMLSSNVAITAERYIYMPSAGFAVMLSAAFLALIGLPDGRKRAFAVFSVLLTVYGSLGMLYFFQAWRSEETFWQHSVRLNPDYVSGYVSLAAIELGRGNEEKGKALLHTGLQKQKGLPAEFAQAAHILGESEMKAGNLSGAESYLKLALRYTPYEFAYIDLGFLYLRVGNLEGARESFEGALGFPQRNVRAVLGLATTYSLMGDRGNARRFAMEAYERARDANLREIAAGIIRENG